MGGSPIGEKGFGGRSEVEANAPRDPRRFPFAVEVEVSEPGDRTEVCHLEWTSLDLFEVTVVAERSMALPTVGSTAPWVRSATE